MLLKAANTIKSLKNKKPTSLLIPSGKVLVKMMEEAQRALELKDAFKDKKRKKKKKKKGHSMKKLMVPTVY